MNSKLQKACKELNSKLPTHSTAQSWLLTRENNTWKIKRQIVIGRSRTYQRLPIILYKQIQQEETKLRQLVARLNNIDPKEQSALEQYEIKSAFFPPKLLSSYHKKLQAEIPSKHVVAYNMNYARKHFIQFFSKYHPNPVIWYKNYQPAWSDYLVENNFSISVIRKIVQSANRLIKYMHNQRPDEIPLLEFRPLSKAMLANIRSKKEAQGQGREKRKYISENDYQILLNYLPKEVKPIFQLCYLYGLRRNEAIGLYQLPNKIRKGYLFINEQIQSFQGGVARRKPPKFNKSRKVNHWYCTPKECFNLIQQILPLCADTYSKKFCDATNEMFKKNKIKYPYVLHDCRHTFISNAAKEFDINTVSRAAGHSDISVTNGYLKDTRDLEDEVFVPA